MRALFRDSAAALYPTAVEVPVDQAGGSVDARHTAGVPFPPDRADQVAVHIVRSCGRTTAS